MIEHDGSGRVYITEVTPVKHIKWGGIPTTTETAVSPNPKGKQPRQEADEDAL